MIDYISIVNFGSWRKISKFRHKKKMHSRDILNLSLLLLILPLRFSFFSFSMLSEALSAALTALRTPQVGAVMCGAAAPQPPALHCSPSSALWSVVGLSRLWVPGGK